MSAGTEPVGGCSVAAADPGEADGAGEPIRRVVVFVTIALALLMNSIDSTIVATALHTLQQGLHTSINWAGWTITAYAFGLVVMLPVTGTLSERYGRRRVFLASICTFTAASLCCGLAGNIYVLIALRAVQAAGGAGLSPSATGIIVDHFGTTRDRAVGLFGSIFPIGSMLGPIFGGLFVTYSSWRAVFFVNVPIGLAVIVLALRFIPRDPPWAARIRRHLDLAGFALLSLSLVAGMLAAAYLGEPGARATSGLFLGPLAVSAVAGVGFVRHMHRTAVPFIAPRLIHGRGFGAVNLVNAIYAGIRIGVIALVPLYAANRYGIDALRGGTLLIAQGVAAVVMAATFTLLLRRTGYRPPLYAGALLIAIGVALLAVTPIGLSPYAWLACSALVVGAGAGTISPPSRNAGLQLAPEHSSTLAAMRTMFTQVGSITTVSVATAILAASGRPGTTQAWIYLAAAGVLLACLPLIARVPEHRGAW